MVKSGRISVVVALCQLPEGKRCSSENFPIVTAAPCKCAPSAPWVVISRSFITLQPFRVTRWAVGCMWYGVLRSHPPYVYLCILPGTAVQSFHRIGGCSSSVHPATSLGSLHYNFSTHPGGSRTPSAAPLPRPTHKD
jgi:hypothetical protein